VYFFSLCTIVAVKAIPLHYMLQSAIAVDLHYYDYNDSLARHILFRPYFFEYLHTVQCMPMINCTLQLTRDCLSLSFSSVQILAYHSIMIVEPNQQSVNYGLAPQHPCFVAD